MSAPARLSVRWVLSLHALLASGAALFLALMLLWPGLRTAVIGQRAADSAEVAAYLASTVRARCGAVPDPGSPCVAELLAAASRGGVRVSLGPAAAPAPAGFVRGSSLLAGPGGTAVLVDAPAAPALDRARRIGRLATGFLLVEALALFLMLYALLVRIVARPADQLLEGLERVGSGEPGLQQEGGPGPGQIGAAFDRMEQRLQQERTRVGSQVEELRRVNRQLSEARDAVVRQEKLATVGRLSAGVAHEVGNPLAAILGYLEVLRARSDEGTRAYVDRMERETHRIDRIVRDLLDFARPARGPSESPVSVREVVERTVRLVETQKRFAGVAITREGLDAELPAVAAEEHYLQQVILNLLVNAADAMEGKGEIHIRAGLADPAHPGRRAGDPTPVPRVALEVRDGGPGIPAADLPRIFDPFFTTKPPGEGTGLGLSICHSLVESLGGSITARNDPEGGAVFRLELPVAGAASASMEGGSPWPSAAS